MFSVYTGFDSKLNDDPLWYKDAIIYELHVKAFFDSSGDGVGDFKGLTQKLDYLVELGVTAIWLLPFYPSPFKDDGYDISDYSNVHSDYGTLADFKVFLREAHRRGLRVITELVINHTSDQHPWFQAARRAKPGSAKRDYYVWSDDASKFSETRVIFCDTESSNWAWDPVAYSYYWHRFYSHQPDLNLNNPKVVREVIRILRFWLELGVDGLRLDAVPYLCVQEGTNNENLPETHQVIKQLRQAIDARFRNKMLLAEANQWPEDVRPYFGDGDECHMAFHFPLMPRIFISLRKEDREPIVDIIQRTPSIPDTCQWALFLRNHDELTLEMVTDEERDYMWAEYARDPRARLNLGIRRRLAPLIDNSFRRMELLNSLLLSFPGTPVIYYGDEIGMGDNIFLGDRNGVRTPMQWSADRNAGFSRADPARLYFPVIMDPVYGYQSVNVEAQEKDPSSFLNFMKRLISLRRQYKAFSRGSFEFLEPANRKVLVYLRRYQEEVILCVVNLARFAQPVELDLREFNGWVPMEIFGRTEFPTIGELPYFLTLGPHSFYWFKLEPEPLPLRILSQGVTGEVAPPTVMVDEISDNLFLSPILRAELAEVFLKYIERQRWYQGSTKVCVGARVFDLAKLGARLFSAFVQVNYADETSDLYFMPVRVAVGESADTLAQASPESVVALIKTPRGGGILADALADKRACQVLLNTILNNRATRTMERGTVRASSSTLLDRISTLDSLFDVRPVGAEQTNSSVVYGDKVILKLYRRLEPGINPELDMLRHLSSVVGFKNVPAYGGHLELETSASVYTLAVATQYVPNDGDGWKHTLSVAEGMMRQGKQGEFGDVGGLVGDFGLFSVNALSAEVDVTPIMGGYGEHLVNLGRRVGEMHRALTLSKSERSFRPETLSSRDFENLFSNVKDRIASSLEHLRRRLDALVPATKALAEEVLGAASQIGERLQEYEKLMQSTDQPLYAIRCHGDLHLGQLLCEGEDFFIFDFEGEPLRSIAERKRKHPAAKDVAGLVRSLSYAAYTAADRASLQQGVEGDKESARTIAKQWFKASAYLFLRAYRESVESVSMLRQGPAEFSTILNTYLLDKEFYELEYELSYRPNWLHIPLIGILDHLSEGLAT